MCEPEIELLAFLAFLAFLCLTQPRWCLCGFILSNPFFSTLLKPHISLDLLGLAFCPIISFHFDMGLGIVASARVESTHYHGR